MAFLCLTKMEDKVGKDSTHQIAKTHRRSWRGAGGPWQERIEFWQVGMVDPLLPATPMQKHDTQQAKS